MRRKKWAIGRLERQEGRDKEQEVGGGGEEEHSGKSPAVRQIQVPGAGCGTTHAFPHLTLSTIL